MVWFILGLVVLIGGGIFAALVGRAFIAVIGVILAAVLIFLSTIYTQEVGEALVIKNADGTIAAIDTQAGMGFKAPWQDTISFDIKNQQALYKLDGKATSPTEQVDGPTITVATSDKASSDVDIAVRYSIDGSKLASIYTDYKNEDTLFERLIAQDIKTVVRDTAAGYTVDTLITQREDYAKKITQNLNERWNDKGIIVESVAPQAIRPPQSIVDTITKSQQAQQALTQAQATTKVKEEEARQRVIEAKGIADANNTLNGSLTENVLKDKYIQALQNAKTLIVAPGTGNTQIQIPAVPAG